MRAAYHGNEECLRALTGAGANFDMKDHAGRTAILLAARNGQKACVELLIEAGSDLEAKDEEGRAIATWVAFYNHHELASLIESVRLSRTEAELMRRETQGVLIGEGCPGRRGPRV